MGKGRRADTVVEEIPEVDPLPNSQDGPGLGGPDLTAERFDASDPRTGVQAGVALEKRDWGTQISFAVSNLSGPRRCQLVIVHTDGTKEPLVSWNVDQALGIGSR
ncbi:hypothetical protein [Paractinoplanes lichenicola]|uniref:Uncharacterized protein n=1 Tax=Paractinoplanes lichenicola TaxID=2802976 RepID=A0ABS1VDK1_9ACTN|nr:hypothetical protein [Actinoplanes lichenicola]MBL7252761.1 hypothetical protein [Actinoplanes lichenicola]